MLKRYTVLLVVLAVAALYGCKKGEPKKDEIPEVAAATDTPAEPDTTITSKDMTFAPEGSDSGQISGLFTVNFEYDKSSLSTDARTKIQKNAEWLKAHPNMTFQIEGHCDRHGSTEYNLALGERRAHVVQAYMKALGLEEEKITTISFGKEKLIDQAESDVADSKNRRANFSVVHASIDRPKM